MANEKTGTIQIDAERLAKLERFEEATRKAAEKSKRTFARDRLLVTKALAQGIKVSEAEIDAYMTAHKR